MAVTGRSVQPVDQKGKKPAIEQESHIVFPPERYGRRRRYVMTNTTRTKAASQVPPTRFQSLRTNFHGASTTAGASAGPILDNDGIDSGVSDLDFEPTWNRPGSYWKNLTAKTEDGKVVLWVAGDMRLVDGYMLVGQELGSLNPPGAAAGDSEARLLREENKMLQENMAQLEQKMEDVRRDKEALQGEMTEFKQRFQKQKDENERLNTRGREVTEHRNEAETKNNELSHKVYKLETTNRVLTESLEKAKADATSLTEQHHQEVQGLEERIDELQTETKRIGKEKTSLEKQVQQVETDKTALELKCRQYEHDKTSLQDTVETLEDQINQMHGVLNVILDRSSLDHDLRDEEIGSLRSDNDRRRAQIEELEEGIYVLYVAYAESETDLDHFRALSEHLQRSSLPTHRQNGEVRRLQARPSQIDLAMVRKKSGKMGVIVKDGEVKWLKRRELQ